MISIRREKILKESIKSVTLGKAFHVYQRRNEWLNWGGDTDLVNRSWTSIYFTLKDAEQYAESSRVQGSKFIIDELPYIHVQSESGILAITELFSESPMASSLPRHKMSSTQKTILELKEHVLGPKWVIAQVFEDHCKAAPLDPMYFSRISSPGKNLNSLGWSLAQRKMNQGPILKFVNEIQEGYL